MSTRMDKYTDSGEVKVKSRASKNKQLYNDVLDMSIDYVNIDVNNAVELKADKNNHTSRENYQIKKEIAGLDNRVEEKEVPVAEPKEEKNRVYDINEILKLAKDNKLFEDDEKKRLINTEYNILTKLDVDSLKSDEMKKEDLKTMIDDIYQNEEPKQIKNYSRKEEEKLLNDLFAEKGEEATLASDVYELNEELSRNILREQESTGTVQITKDYELANEEIKPAENEEENLIKNMINEKTEEPNPKYDKEETSEEMYQMVEEKEGKGLMIAIIVVVILILLTGAFFVYEYFFGA